MKLAYEAVDAAGKSVSGTADADDMQAGMDALHRQGLFVTRINPVADKPEAAPVTRKASRLGKMKRMRRVAMFCRQLYVLVTSGTALVDSLGALERQASEAAWKSVITQLRMKVEQGETLSKAMESHPDYFDSIARSLIAAGESGGSFDSMLDRLASLIRKQVQTRNAVRGAMIYPCLLVIVSIAVLTLMLTFVLPRFAQLFASMDVPLPPTTKFLMFLSDGLSHYWWAVILAGLGAAGGLYFWVGTEPGRIAIHTFLVRMPVFGLTIRNFTVARIIRVLGVLICGKVPLLEALSLTKQTAGNIHYRALMVKAEEAVIRGSSISSVFAESDLITPSLTEAIRSGEQSAQIGGLLLNMADFMDEENEVVVKSLTSIIEPIILIVLGLLVGFIAMSMFLPLFDLTSMTQRGG
jgi:type II secretory pathway component PulF